MELRRLHARRGSLLQLAPLALALVSARAHGSDDTSSIVGGDDAEVCDFPSTVLLRDLDGIDDIAGNEDDFPQFVCSGVLVHPRLALTAGHCIRTNGQGLQVVSFGENVDLMIADPEVVAEVPVERCARHPDFVPTNQNWDLGYCILAEDAPGVPITPPLMGCEAEIISPGLELVTVGFGQNVDGPRPLGTGTKRWTTQTIQAFEFLENNIAMMGQGSNSTCFGDSGGPAFVRLADQSWRVVGTASTLHPVFPMSCGFGAIFELVHTLVPWVEQDSGIDITPCHDADGTWNPAEGCGEFPVELVGEGDSWETSCGNAPRSGPSETCGEPWIPPPDPEASTGSSDEGADGPSTSDSESSPGGTGSSAGLDDEGEGCGCRSVPSNQPLSLMLLLLGLGAIRNRRPPMAGREDPRPGAC